MLKHLSGILALVFFTNLPAHAEQIVPANSQFEVAFISEHEVNEQNQPEHVTLKILSQPADLVPQLPKHCLISGEATLNEVQSDTEQVSIAINKLFCITSEKDIWDLNASGHVHNLNAAGTGIQTPCIKKAKSQCANAKLVAGKRYQLTFDAVVDTSNTAEKPGAKKQQ